MGAALGAVLSAIGEGLANEVFPPKTLHVIHDKPVSGGNLMPADQVDWVEIKGHGALYRFTYDWHIEVGG